MEEIFFCGESLFFIWDSCASLAPFIAPLGEAGLALSLEELFLPCIFEQINSVIQMKFSYDVLKKCHDGTLIPMIKQ